MNRLIACLAMLLLVFTACGTNDGVFENGPRLVSEVTLPPVTLPPTRALSPTPSPVATEPTDVPPVITMTADDFEMVTPTLPPSKTPTQTPTISPTPAATATTAPTRVIQVQTQEPILVPTIVYVPPSQVIAAAPNATAASPAGQISIPLPGVPDVPAASCSIPWFFTNPRLPDCPLNAPMVTDAAFQGFEYGFMIWVGAQDAIYVFFDSVEMPRWQVFQDTYEEGMPDTDPNLDALAPPYADWQPRRGFGLVWRNTPGLIDRIGWAESAYENAYTIQVQTRTDGTIFLQEPYGRVFSLSPDGNWQLYNR